MLKKLILLVLTILLITIGVLYLLKNNDVEEGIVEQSQNENITNEVEEYSEEPIVEKEISTTWVVFENTDYSYTFQYQPDWTIDSEDMERVWVSFPEEEASIVFASATATQTGFPEYEIISSEIFLMDENVDTTVAILQSENTMAIISGFESENHPHFVMMSYEYQNEEHHQRMIELNEEFLSRITFQ